MGDMKPPELEDYHCVYHFTKCYILSYRNIWWVILVLQPSSIHGHPAHAPYKSQALRHRLRVFRSGTGGLGHFGITFACRARHGSSGKNKLPCVWMDNIHLPLYTSSTTQGGGGNLKNKKPIGEVGCCESRMAERIHWWIERWLELCFLQLDLLSSDSFSSLIFSLLLFWSLTSKLPSITHGNDDSIYTILYIYICE